MKKVKSYPDVEKIKKLLHNRDKRDPRHVYKRKLYGRRSSLPISKKILAENRLPNFPDNNENFFLVRDYFLQRKQGIQIRKMVIESRLSHIIRALPVIIAVGALGLHMADVSSDGVIAKWVCDYDYCNCEYQMYGNGSLGCSAPGDICGAGLIAQRLVRSHCRDAGNSETACNKADHWPLPQKCRCMWWGSMRNCVPIGIICWGMVIGNTTAVDYCNHRKAARECLNTTWDTPQEYRTQRFPARCRISLTFIIGPSIITNMVLLFSLLQNGHYKTHLKNAGVPKLGEMELTKVAIGIFALLQILPYLCMGINIVILGRIYMKKGNATNKCNALQITNVRICILFSVFEDLPQLYIQGKYFMTAAHGYSYGLVDWTSGWIIVQLTTSVLSLCKNYTQFIVGQRTGKIMAFMTFSTSFLTTGGRVMICGISEALAEGWLLSQQMRLTLFAGVCLPPVLKYICKLCCTYYRKPYDPNNTDINSHIVPSKDIELKAFNEISQIIDETTRTDRQSACVIEETCYIDPNHRIQLIVYGLYTTNKSQDVDDPIHTVSPNTTPEPLRDEGTPTVSPNTTPGTLRVEGTPTVSPNTTPGTLRVEGTPTVSPNTTPGTLRVEGTPTVSPNTTPGPLRVEGTPTVSPNTTPGPVIGEENPTMNLNTAPGPHVDKRIPNVSPKINSPVQSIWHKSLALADKTVAVIRALIFSFTIDGQSIDGLWSGAVFAIWALLIKLYYFTNKYYRVNPYATEAATTALTLAMLSLTMNALMVMASGKHRRQCLLILVLYTTYPTYAYNTARYNRELDGAMLMLQKILRSNYYTNDSQAIDGIIDTLEYIFTMMGLLICFNIILLFVSKVEASKTAGENADTG